MRPISRSMSTEQHQRCRYHPHCEIHIGHPRPAWFTRRNHEEMREMRMDGSTYEEIAEAFECARSTVQDIVQGRVHRLARD